MISINLVKFYHGIVLTQLKQADELIFNDLNFKLRPKPLKLESFKQLLKALNLNYPFEGDVKKPTMKCEPKEICDHILWLERVAGESGFELEYVAEEYRKLMYEAGIIVGVK